MGGFRAAACYYPGMDKKHLFAAAAALAVVFLVVPAHAQSSSAVFSGPQNMDQGLLNGLNNLTGYVYAILKFLSLIGLGIAYYFVTHHGVGKAILATIAAIMLWFSPVVANIAQNIGAAAAQQSTVSSSPGG
jgi:hypothetical protein